MQASQQIWLVVVLWVLICLGLAVTDNFTQQLSLTPLSAERSIRHGHVSSKLLKTDASSFSVSTRAIVGLKEIRSPTAYKKLPTPTCLHEGWRTASVFVLCAVLLVAAKVLLWLKPHGSSPSPTFAAIVGSQPPGGSKLRNQAMYLHRLKANSGGTNSVVFSPDGLTVYSGGSDGTIGIWRRVQGERIGTWIAHTQEVRALAISSDGRTLVSAGKDRTIRIWDTATGAVVRTIEKAHKGEITSLTLTTNGHKIISGSYDFTVGVWDVESGDKLNTLVGHRSCISSVALFPDDRRIATAGWDQMVRVVDILTGLPTAKCHGHTEKVTCAAVSPDGRRIATGCLDRKLRLWDSFGTPVIMKPNVSPPVLKESGISAICFSPDGEHVATGSLDGSIRIWETDTGNRVRTLVGHEAPVTSLVYSANGKRLASSSWDDTVCIWNAKTEVKPRIKMPPTMEIDMKWR
eukprot:EG_transcript_10026